MHYHWPRQPYRWVLIECYLLLCHLNWLYQASNCCTLLPTSIIWQFLKNRTSDCTAEKPHRIIVPINSHLPLHGDVRTRVCKQNPSEQGAMAWNWREPTGKVSPWYSPPLPLLLSTSQCGVTVRQAAGGTEPRERGVEQCYGPLCQPQTRIREIAWDSLLGWAKESGGKSSCLVFFSHFFTSSLGFSFRSVSFSEAVIRSATNIRDYIKNNFPFIWRQKRF